MKKAALAAFSLCCAALGFLVCTASIKSAQSASFGASGALQPKTIEKLDLDRYGGLWHEVARLPNRFQDLCASNVNANYRKLPSGSIEVINRCLNEQGEVKEVVGEARVVEVQSNAKLEVRFAPAWLSFIPLVWGDYWVLHVEPDYSAAVVGSPDRKFLWVLARNPQLNSKAIDGLVEKAKAQGFAAHQVVRTIQK